MGENHCDTINFSASQLFNCAKNKIKNKTRHGQRHNAYNFVLHEHCN